MIFFRVEFLLQIYIHFFKVLQQADIHLLELINRHRLTFLDTFFIFVTDIATVVTYAFPIILLIVAYATHKFLLQRKSWLMLISLTLTSTLADTIKKVVHRPRPFVTYPFIHHLVDVTTYSFPSGHTAEVSLMAISFSILFPQNKWGNLLVWFWALLIAYSRMDLGVHYPSDVLGSFILSAIVALGFIHLMTRLGFCERRKEI